MLGGYVLLQRAKNSEVGGILILRKSMFIQIEGNSYVCMDGWKMFLNICYATNYH